MRYISSRQIKLDSIEPTSKIIKLIYFVPDILDTVTREEE